MIKQDYQVIMQRFSAQTFETIYNVCDFDARGGMDIKRQVINTPYIVYPKIYLFSRILAQNSEIQNVALSTTIQNFWEKNYLQMGGG